MLKIARNALLNCRTQSKRGPQFPYGMCLSVTESAFGTPHWYPDATAAWKGATKKHVVTNPADYANIPAGVPIYWTGGSHGHGHICPSAGHGKCWSSDINRSGYFDLVSIEQIERLWGLKFEGWSEDLAGVTVYQAPKKPTRVSKAIDSTQHALALLNDAINKSHRKGRVKKFNQNLVTALREAKKDGLTR